MHRPLALLALVSVAACQGPGSSPVPEARADEPSPTPISTGVALLELFTSEGCSSCPPADALLGRLAARPGVLALSFHVDYWDQLGWPDRFASADNTARQTAYARSMGARGLFTPELVVGGTEGFTGSDAERADAAIVRAQASAQPVHLVLHAWSTGAEATVRYEASGAPVGSTLNVAVVERSTSSEVRAGENAGRTLHHANVVRAFENAPLAASGTVTLRLPPTLRLADTAVIAYAQRTAGGGSGMPVLGASSARFDSHE